MRSWTVRTKGAAARQEEATRAQRQRAQEVSLGVAARPYGLQEPGEEPREARRGAEQRVHSPQRRERRVGGGGQLGALSVREGGAAPEAAPRVVGGSPAAGPVAARRAAAERGRGRDEERRIPRRLQPLGRLSLRRGGAQARGAFHGPLPGTGRGLLLQRSPTSRRLRTARPRLLLLRVAHPQRGSPGLGYSSNTCLGWLRQSAAHANSVACPT